MARQARPGGRCCEGEERGSDGAGVRFRKVGRVDGGAQFAFKGVFEELPGGEQIQVPFTVGLEIRQGTVRRGVEREQGELDVVASDDALGAVELLAGEGEMVGARVRPGESGEHGLAQRPAREERKLQGLQGDRHGETPSVWAQRQAWLRSSVSAIPPARGRPLTQLCTRGSRVSSARICITGRAQMEAVGCVGGGGSKAIRRTYSLARQGKGTTWEELPTATVARLILRITPSRT